MSYNVQCFLNTYSCKYIRNKITNKITNKKLNKVKHKQLKNKYIIQASKNV
jgi:hypothetical protein